jgi:hypothetical protein
VSLPGTDRQNRLAVELEEGKPSSWTRKMLKSGYSEATARSDAKDIRERPGVVRARQAIRERNRTRRDTARELLDFCMARVGELAPHLTDLKEVLATMQVLATVIEKAGDTEPASKSDVTPEEYRRLIQNYVRRIVRVTLRRHAIQDDALLARLDDVRSCAQRRRDAARKRVGELAVVAEAIDAPGGTQDAAVQDAEVIE